MIMAQRDEERSCNCAWRHYDLTTDTHRLQRAGRR